MYPGVYLTGNIVVDTLVRPVERLPEWGSTSYVESIAVHLGGNGAGAAVATAMMGVPARLAGAVGDDAPGRFALGHLRDTGVDVSRVRALEGVATAQTVALISPTGERLFWHELGACGVFSIGELPFDRETVEGIRFFHYGSVFCLPGLRASAGDALRSARAAGLETSLDVDWDTSGEWLRLIEPLCPLLDWLFLNLQEAEKLTGLREAAAVGEFFRSRGVGTVVVKLGAGGCEIFTQERRLGASAFDVPVVDTTGAGDCFCGGFLAGLCRGLTLEEAARLANAVAAHTVQCAGNSKGLVDYAATRAWMGERSRAKIQT